MHNTFRRRLAFILLASVSIWIFLWYTHSLVDRLNDSDRRNCETIARLWAGVQYPLSVVGDGSGIMSCTVCGSPAESPFTSADRDSLFCSSCEEKTLFIRTLRLLPAEREDIIISTRRLFAEVVNRLDFPTIFSDVSGHPQIVDGTSTDSFDDERLGVVRRRMEMLGRENDPVPLIVRSDTIGFLYYGSSSINSEMALIPFLELGLLLAAAAVIFLLLRSEISSERNMSWVGFARETAHQLSTPLSSLMGWLELLEDDESVMSNPDIVEAVSHMNSDVKRLGSIAARYGQMGRKPRFEPVFVKEIISDTTEYFISRPGLLGTGVILETRGDCSGALIMGNTVLLGWVLENIIKNAVAACASIPGGGRITLECRQSMESTSRIEIQISDNGNGIPYPDQGKIFKAGFTTRTGGWGLGLSLARRIVEEYHRGSLRLVSSAPGSGTVFLIDLPLMKGGEFDNNSLGG